MGTNGSSLSFEREIIAMNQGTPNANKEPHNSSPNREDNDGATINSTTFITFVPPPQPELVCEVMNSNPGISTIPTPDLTEYLKNIGVPGSAHVLSARTGGGSDVGQSGSPDHLSFYPSGFGGGGDGDDIRPDNVSDEFQLDKIGGLEDQKEYLRRSIILPLACPELLQEWGVSPPKGILLHGPPGTGKTFMAKSLVNELTKHLPQKVKFFYRKGGDVFSMWFGESQKKLRQVFDAAKRNAPSVIFFDEIDGLCPSRDSQNHGTEAYSSVVTCFLGQMDELKNGEVFVIAATNRLDAVDPAVRRPGRFDKHLTFGFPDDIARRKIIEIHTSKWRIEDRPEPALLIRLSQKTMGFSGADLEKLCKDVVYSAIEDNNGVITDAMEVAEKHWLHAISGMQRTSANHFGSALYMPTKPNQLVSTLTKPVVDKALEYISPMLQFLDVDSTTIRKSLLIYITPQQSKSFLNEQIIPGLLSDEEFNKVSFFEITTSSVLNKMISTAKPTVFAAIRDVIMQAKDFETQENCTMLIVKNINELLALAHANNISTKLVLKTLGQIQGPRMLLLATSSVPLDEINEPGITELFSNRVMKAENPREGELMDFFQFVLQQRVGAQHLARLKPILDETAKKAAKLAQKDDYQLIINLAIELEKHLDDDIPIRNTLQNDFNDTLGEYQRSKLRQ